MSNINSYQFLDTYKELNIDIKKLYCTMLDVEWTEATKKELSFLFTNIKPFTSTNKPWIKGLVGLDKGHLTLLYGTLDGVTAEHVKEVLKDINLADIKVKIKEVSYFDSPDTEEYYCVVAKVELTNEILGLHKRLSLLPHINTFLDYTPHITLGYIEKSEAKLNNLIWNSQWHQDGITAKQSLEAIPTAITYDNNSGEPKIIK